MHRTEGTNNDSNLFTDGPPGTVVESHWLNSVQEEISNVVEQAGIVLATQATDTRDQLYAAIMALATGAGLRGYVSRARFVRKDNDEIYIWPGEYHHSGTSNQTVYWDSVITFRFGPAGSNPDSSAMAVNTWLYLYLDDSAIVTAGSRELTASEFLGSVTAPTWSDAKHGWYNGNDRCIFAAKTNAAGNLEVFWHSGDFVLLDDADWTSLGDIDNVWTDYILDIPDFGVMQANFWMINNGDAANSSLNGYWRTKGSAGGHVLTGHTYHDSEELVSVATVITDEDQTVQVRFEQAGSSTMTVGADGWYFPCGM